MDGGGGEDTAGFFAEETEKQTCEKGPYAPPGSSDGIKGVDKAEKKGGHNQSPAPMGVPGAKRPAEPFI